MDFRIKIQKLQQQQQNYLYIESMCTFFFVSMFKLERDSVCTVQCKSTNVYNMNVAK